MAAKARQMQFCSSPASQLPSFVTASLAPLRLTCALRLLLPQAIALACECGTDIGDPLILKVRAAAQITLNAVQQYKAPRPPYKGTEALILKGHQEKLQQYDSWSMITALDT